MSNLGISVMAWHARMPVVASAGWQQAGSLLDGLVDARAPMRHLSMMAARRLGSGDRLVVDGVLSLLASHSADALVLCSRHGELERNDRIMRALAAQASVSPTDFTMSVHNAAAGTCTIAAGLSVVSSSLSAGVDTFQQAFFEVMSLFHTGHQRVLLADFEGVIPSFYREQVGVTLPVAPYAVCLLLAPGTQWLCRPQAKGEVAQTESSPQTDQWLPQSVQWLRGMLSENEQFVVEGQSHLWRWSRMP